MFPNEPPPAALEGFDLLERLGAGAFGEVFLARSPGGKLVAIKTIGGALAGDERFAESFVREASVCARLRHPCVVQVRALLEAAGFAALVFEYVPGVALGRVLRLCEAKRVRLPDGAAWHIVERVLSALVYAHAFRDGNGAPTPIVHRDLSPSNVLVDWEGGVKIADFGIAKVLGVSPATRVGLVKGTLGCMAPEQARGEPVDERADVYAAALLAWRLATGRVPFGRHQRDEIEMLRAMRNPRIKPLGVIRPDLPGPLLLATAQALEPDAARRTISAEELAAVVRAHVDIEAGQRQLASLLEGWKPELEKAVRRTTERSSDASAPRLEHTLRYEEVALAFDDEPGADGPTFEGHALPSESAPLDGTPADAVGEPHADAGRADDAFVDSLPNLAVASVPDASRNASDADTAGAAQRPDGEGRMARPRATAGAPAAGPSHAARAAAPAEAPSRAPQRPRMWGPVLALGAFVVAWLIAAWLATCTLSAR